MDLKITITRQTVVVLQVNSYQKMAQLLHQAAVNTFTGEVGQHSWSVEECESFVDFINTHPSLVKDSTLLNLPLKSDGLFDGVKDGVLLW